MTTPGQGYRWDSGVNFAAASDVTPLRWTNVEDYDAVGDGISDDTDAINEAAAVANAITPSAVLWRPLGVLHFPAGKIYRTTAALDPWLCNVMGIGAEILFDPSDASTGTAVSLGNNTSPMPANLLVYFPVVQKKVRYWSSSLTGTDVGIKMAGVNGAEIHIRAVRDFTIGALATGSPSDIHPAFVYNNVHINHLDDNKVNLKLTDGGAGYCNENNFYGGQFSMDSDRGSNIPGARHILLEASATVTSWPNNNRFFGQSVEGNGPEYHIECQGPYNVFHQARWEASTPKCYFNGSQARFNMVSYGYGSMLIQFTQANGASENHVMTQRFFALEGLAGASGMIRVANTSGNDYPAVLVADASKSPLVDDMATGWRTMLSGSSIAAKALADTGFAVRMNTSGKVEFGDRAGAVTATVHSGPGTPEGSVAAAPGSLYLRTDGGPTRSVYVKASGTSTTGWGAAGLLPTTRTSYSDTNITPNADYRYHAWSPSATRTVAAPSVTEPLVGQQITFDITNAGVAAIEPAWNSIFVLSRRFALAAP